MDRKRKAIKTANSGIILNIIIIFLGFVTQSLFIKTLGIEYSGVNAVFTSVISIMTMADLGVSTAVIFNLYEPLAKNNKKKIAALMQFYRKACFLIGFIILSGGVILLPFASMMLGEKSIDANVYIIFAAFIINAVFMYFLNYRRPILLADQSGYIVNWVMTSVMISQYVIKITILLFTKNYYLFTFSIIFCRLAENFIINRIVDKKYPYIHQKNTLDKKTKKDIKQKIYASIYHNTATYIVFSTDNIILSQLFGIFFAGIYSNYFMITNSLSKLVSQIFGALTSGMGNIYAKEGKDYLYKTTKNIILLNSWIYTMISVAIFFCINSFIEVWIGKDYLLPSTVVIAIVFNFYLQGLRAPMSNVLGAAGILYENRFIPLIEAAINLVASIVLAKIIGLSGIFIGTILSNLFLHMYSYSKYGFKLVFRRDPKEYIKILFKNIAMFGICIMINYLFLHPIKINSALITFFIRGIVSIINTSIIFFIFYRKTEEFRYLYDSFKKMLGHRSRN